MLGTALPCSRSTTCGKKLGKEVVFRRVGAILGPIFALNPTKMALKLLYSLGWLLAASVVLGQPLDYDLNEYHARYDRRPAMYLSPYFFLSGQYRPKVIDNNYISALLPFYWRNERNTDEERSSWRCDFQGSFLQNQQFLVGISESRTATINFNALVEHRQEYYQHGNRMSGWSVAGDLSFNDNVGGSAPNRSRAVNLRPSIFLGWGRIEYAEDALLASWMLEDLVDQWVIDDYTRQDLEGLARTITDIIGNRTFDQRRRRIYEQGRLFQSLEGLNIQEDGFMLFSVLSDNWLFANRVVLPHGRQWEFGVQSYLGMGVLNNQGDRKNTETGFLPYLTYRHASILSPRAGFEYYLGGQWGWLRESKAGLPELERDEIVGRLMVGTINRWFPSSRSTIVWQNDFGWQWSDAFPTESVLYLSPGRQLHWDTDLQVNHFFSYVFNMELSVAIRVVRSYAREYTDLQPRITLRSTYFFL